jgi:hypothetical protein
LPYSFDRDRPAFQECEQWRFLRHVLMCHVRRNAWRFLRRLGDEIACQQ